MASRQQPQREKQYLTLLEFELDPEKETAKAYRVRLPLYHHGQQTGARTSRWAYVPKSGVNWRGDDMQIEAWLVASKEQDISTTVFNGDKVEVLCVEGEAVRSEMTRKDEAQQAQAPRQQYQPQSPARTQQQAPAAAQPRRHEPEPADIPEAAEPMTEGDPDEANDYWFS